MHFAGINNWSLCIISMENGGFLGINYCKLLSSNERQPIAIRHTNVIMGRDV